MPPAKPPKKSEMLEVRLSYEDKQNLQRKARKNGQSVSEVVRQLISDYLSSKEPHSLFQAFTDVFARTNLKIKSSLAVVGVLIAAPLSPPSPIYSR